MTIDLTNSEQFLAELIKALLLLITIVLFLVAWGTRWWCRFFNWLEDGKLRDSSGCFSWCDSPKTRCHCPPRLKFPSLF